MTTPLRIYRIVLGRTGVIVALIVEHYKSQRQTQSWNESLFCVWVSCACDSNICETAPDIRILFYFVVYYLKIKKLTQQLS